MLRLDAEMRGVDRQDARHLAADAVGRIGGAEQRQHRVLHPAGKARGRAPGRQQHRQRARRWTRSIAAM